MRRADLTRLGLGLLLAGAIGCAKLPVPPGDGVVAETAFSHDAWQRFLAHHVDGDGRIDYRAAAADRADLDAYLAALAAASPDSAPGRFPTEAERLAYWINAYNAGIVHGVLAYYPIASVRDVRPPLFLRFLPRGAGFFVFQRVVLGDTPISFYALENRLIRKRFDEPRIHFALNCASIGCPRLPAEVFLPEKLEAQLARETRFFLSEERNVAVDPGRGEIVLSSIFDWYEEDFLDPAAGVESLVDYVAPFLDSERRAALAACGTCEVVFRPYDWGLNDRAASH